MAIEKIDTYTAVGIVEGIIDTDREQMIKAWQYLIDTGLAWSLQGNFGRTAHALIVAGVCRAAERGAI
jgi:hypothetical protein